MARRLLNPLVRREVLYGVRTPRETLLELADAYFNEGLVFDAADFLAQARDRDGLSRIRKRAIEMGDAFLLRRVHETFPDLVSDSDWDELGLRARSLGKELYVERAESGGAPLPPPLVGQTVPDEDAAEAEAQDARAQQGAPAGANASSRKSRANRAHKRGRARRHRA